MPKSLDISKKVEEVREILLRYGGMPSQADNRAAYSKVAYFIKAHSEDQEVKNLINEFNLSIRKYNKDKDSQIEEIKAILEERMAMPHSSQEKALYGQVKDFFRKYKDDPEIEKLKFQYVGPSCFPLQESAYEKCPATNWYEYAPGRPEGWKPYDSFEYVVYVWKRYKILPAENTKPMQEVRKKINYYYRYTGKRSDQYEIDSLFALSKIMEELGCEDNYLRSFNHVPEFDTEAVQKRVRDMVIENGSCAINYIPEMAIPGVSLPEKYVYYYYYNCFYEKDDYWTIRPLGFLYVVGGDYGQYFLRVHFRDYFKCDINKIRKSAQAHYRNWSENPPQTIEDWKYYGQWGLFVEDYGNREGIQLNLLCDDWSETILDRAFKTSDRYFYVYDRFKYFDYILFLLENNYMLWESDITRWIAKWIDALGWNPEDKIIRQKVRDLLRQKGINLKELKKYGSI